MTAEIRIDNASLRFRIYRNPSPALKEKMIDFLTRRRTPDEVIEFEAVKNLSLTICGGERVGIIGLNGAGKSTLLKMISGIYPASKGSIAIRGKVTPLIEVGTGFDAEMTGRQNIYINGALLALPRDEVKAREEHIIEFSGLKTYIDVPIKYYSTGMVGRLAFSIATMIEPEILLVDEVFSTGDALFVDKATARMLSLFDCSQILVLVSHNMDLIEEFCNRVIVLHKGEVVGDGPPEEMIDFYHTNIAGLVPDTDGDDPLPAEPLLPDGYQFETILAR